MTANPVALVPGTSLCFYLGLIFVVSRRRGEIRGSSLLMLYLAWMAAWSGSSVLYRLTEGDTRDYLLLPVLVFFGMMVPAVFLYFVQAYYPTRWDTAARTFSYATALLVAAGAVSGTYTHMVATAATTLGYVILSTIILVWLLGSYFVNFAYIAATYRASRDPVERNRLKYLGWALLLTVLGGSTNTVPALQAIPLDQAINAAAAGIIAFAIVPPRPININVILRRVVTDAAVGLMNVGLVLAAAYGMVTGAGLPLFSAPAVLLTTAVGVVAAVLTPYLRSRLDRHLERLMFGRDTNRRQLLLDFTQRMAGVLSLQQFSAAMADLCARAIDSSYVALLVPDDGGREFRLAHATGDVPRALPEWTVHTDNGLLPALTSAAGPVLAASLMDGPEAGGVGDRDAREVAPYRECLLCPVTSRERVIGILVAGPKVYGGAFSLEDTEILSVVARQAAVVLENVRLFAEVQRQAQTDALTGLPNRTLFATRFEEAQAAARVRGRRVAVLFLDLDRFKTINDSAGHAVGDELLVALGRRLADVVKDVGTVIRFGGDEFVIILRGVRTARQAEAVAERILTGLRPPFTVGGRDVVVTASIGIALGDGRARSDANEVLRNADMALYTAKAAGRARCAVYQKDMALRFHQRLNLETALWNAVERGDLTVHYQPEVDLFTGTIVGVEALVRWYNQELGPVSPEDFVPIAEENGLIGIIGARVLEEACRQAQVWRRDGINSSLVVSVNLSPRELQEPSVVDHVADVLSRTGLDPAGLRLEITENIMMGDAPSTLETLDALKRLGVQLAIDDFGAGYSSLSYLHRFPADSLKVDRSFVHELGQNERSLPIVGAVIAAAHALGIAVTAEGVETAEQLTRLREVGCDRGQGFYFSRPLPPDAVTSLLMADRPLLAPGGVAA